MPNFRVIRAKPCRSNSPAAWRRVALAAAPPAVFALLLAACEFTAFGLPHTTRSRSALKTMYPANPSYHPIELRFGPAERPYAVLGTAQSKNYREDELDALAAGDLQRMAREMGGDAVIDIEKRPVQTEEIGYSPGALSRIGPYFVVRYCLVGTVVRYVEGAARPAAPSAPASPAISPDIPPYTPQSAPAGQAMPSQ